LESEGSDPVGADADQKTIFFGVFNDNSIYSCFQLFFSSSRGLKRTILEFKAMEIKKAVCYLQKNADSSSWLALIHNKFDGLAKN